MFKLPESEFSATLIKNDTDEYERVNFTVTLVRDTLPNKTFVIYVKLGGINVYFSNINHDFECSENNKLLSKNSDMWKCGLNKLQFIILNFFLN